METAELGFLADFGDIQTGRHNPMSTMDDTSSPPIAASASDNHRAAYSDIDHIVVSQDDIAHRVAQLAQEITTCYDGREITLLAVLTGSLVFLADLMRRLSMPLQVGVVAVCSYPSGATTSGKMRFTIPLAGNLVGRDVLIIDDILDSGHTLSALRAELTKQNAASIRTCVLLSKNKPSLPHRTPADFVGFNVDDEFVVGYGLDHNHRYRNLTDICVLKCHARSPALGDGK